MAKNLVTVITPVYNNKNDIVKAIKSIENQNYKNWEYIIVNDCSTDGTLKTINDYLVKSKHKDKIRVISNKVNKGAYYSRNVGLSEAKGVYITILDSDDRFNKTKIGKQVRRLNRNPRIVSVGCWLRRGKGKIRKNYQTSHMFRKAIVKQIGYFDSVRFGGDSEFRDRIRTKYGARRIAVIPQVLYYATARKGSLTRSPVTRNRKVRRRYINNYRRWHKNAKTKNKLYMKFPIPNKGRPFSVPKVMRP